MSNLATTRGRDKSRKMSYIASIVRTCWRGIGAKAANSSGGTEDLRALLLERALPVEHDGDWRCGGFEVAVHDAAFVGGFEGVGDLVGDAQSGVERHGSFGRLAFDVFHHQVIGADVVDLADVGMVERGDGFGFALEAFGELGGGDFDGDVAVEAGVVGAVDFAHAAGADGGLDFVEA